MDPLASLPSSQNHMAAGFSHEAQRLSYRGMQVELALSDNQGRSVRLNFSHEQLNYNRTYTAAGVIASDIPPGRNGDRAGHAAFTNSVYQAGLVHEEQSLSAERTTIEVEGDISLLQDYFSAESTAQRVFDFITGLGKGIEAGTEAFGSFVDEITSGMRQGFAEASDMLGGLAEISHRTHDLLEDMLTRFRETGTHVSVEDLIGSDANGEDA
ncbi:MAG: DUF5610 domain-containing protein [Planctomycetota bacterium]|jgi:hypothetical protein|nr:DUF5610 domain-containing protein [Planctomycetota bacterium]